MTIHWPGATKSSAAKPQEDLAEYREVNVSHCPAYVAYFHRLAGSGVADEAKKTLGIYTIPVCPIDKRCHEGLDKAASITLEYNQPA